MIGHANAHARRLVDVRGADALARGVDATLAELGVEGAVECRVVRHDQVRVLRDVQVAVERDAALNEHLHLFDE